jgi:DNA polymerase (family X)
VADPTNSRIALAFDELADLYELDGAIVHRVVAYRNAAKAVRDAPTSVAALTREGRVTSLPGIGKTLEEKIRALMETGDIPAAVKLRGKFPPGLVEMTHVPGLGPKRARVLFDELGIASIAALKEAAEGERLRDLKGFGAKAEANILAGIASLGDDPASAGQRVLLSKAMEAADAILGELRGDPSADRVELAGSARRWAETVKDLDIIATSHEPARLSAVLTGLPFVESAGDPGEAGARVVTHTGMKVDLRIVAPDQFGNLLQHFTGSKNHNMALREAAVRRGLHVSEYGVLDDATGETLRCTTEEEVYAALGYAWIPPELREDRGELQAAANGGLPELLAFDALKGDLHCHTVASDGRNTITEMALAARELGYEYLAITDHSATHGFGNHVSPDDLLRHAEAVRRVDAEVDGIRLLAGSEVNILPDGAPDYADEILAELDWAVGSIHTSFRMSREQMTRRFAAACEHPLIDCLGHPSGRLILRREPYDVDFDAVFEAAARTGTMIEINANPNRRDLSETNARAAAAAGVRICVNSDAHGRETLPLIRYGIATARRGWLTAEQVANTRGWEEFAPLRKRAR